MFAIFKREVRSCFHGMIGYVLTAFLLVASAIYFVALNLGYGLPDFGYYTLYNTIFMLLFYFPVLTMRSIAEERRTRTDQLLLTSPVSVWGIVLGKFFAACTVFLLTLVCTGVYVIILSAYGNVSGMEVFVNYLGFFLMGCCLISVGLFMSTLSENQVASAISTFGVILFLYLLDSIISSMSSVTMLSWLCTALKWVSLFARFTDFSSGILSLTGVIYMISFAGIFLLLTVYTIEKRRWSEG